jgi:nucleotide-binding universal stress UspA family protein
MTAPSQDQPAAPGPPAATTPFARVACGVSGTRMSKVAVELAIELAESGSALDFLAFTDARGTGASLMAGTGAARAQTALDAARRAAADHGAVATGELRHHPEPRRALLAAAAEHDLLVVGARPGSRAGGIMLGSTATLALHECPAPVLIARPVPGDRRLTERILVATSGSAGDRRVADVAARLAAAAGGTVTLLHVEGPSGPAVRHELATEASEVLAVTGTEPVVAVVRGHGAEPILETAEELQATLLVLGSRGLTGVRSLASVSERVGAGASCPVLVIKERPAR